MGDAADDLEYDEYKRRTGYNPGKLMDEADQRARSRGREKMAKPMELEPRMDQDTWKDEEARWAALIAAVLSLKKCWDIWGEEIGTDITSCENTARRMLQDARKKVRAKTVKKGSKRDVGADED